MSLGKKLAIPIIIINLLLMIIIYIVSEKLISKNFEEDYMETMKEQTVSIEKVIEKIKAETASTSYFFNNSAQVLTAIQKGDQEVMEKFAFDSLEAFGLDLLLLIKSDGTLLYSSDAPASYGIDMSNDYMPHTAAMQGEVFCDLITIGEKIYICSAAPVYGNDGSIIASLTYAYDLSSEKFVDYYGSMTDNDMTVFHNKVRAMTTLVDDTGKRMIGSSLSDPHIIDEVIDKGNQYYGKTVIQNRNYLCSYTPLESQGNDCIIIFLGKDLTDVEVTAYRTAKLISEVIAGITVFSILVIGFFIYFFIRRPLNRLTKTLNDITPENGELCNLTIKVPENSKDEIGIIGKQFNYLLQEIRKIVESIISIHTKLSNASENLAASSEETSASAITVSGTMGNIAEAAQSQLAEAKNGTFKLNVLTDNLSGVAKNATHMKNSANETVNVTKTGLTSVRLLKEVAKDNYDLVSEMSNHVDGLTEKSEAIGSIVDAIANIASQTNLLSLNASIEAARAGEAGKGFSVVAGEIRGLAEQSRASAQNIHNLLSDIEDEIKETAGLMESITKTFLEQNTAVSNTESTFGEISESVGNAIASIESVSVSLFEMEQEKEKLVKSMKSISETSALSSKSTEDANLSIREITSAIESVAKLAKDLNEVSIELKKKIKIFIL